MLRFRDLIGLRRTNRQCSRGGHELLLRRPASAASLVPAQQPPPPVSPKHNTYQPTPLPRNGSYVRSPVPAWLVRIEQDAKRATSVLRLTPIGTADTEFLFHLYTLVPRIAKPFPATTAALLAALTPHVGACRASLGPEILALALYSLRFIPASWPELVPAFSALTAQLARSRLEPAVEPWTPLQLGQAFQGLQNEGSRSAAGRAVLTELAPLAEECVARSPGVAVPVAAVVSLLRALRHCSSEDREVRRAVAAMTPLVARCTDALDAADIGALNGLARCFSAHTEVRGLVAALVPLVIRCRGPVDVASLSTALAGTAGLCSDDAPSRDMFAALLALVPGARGTFRSSDIVSSLMCFTRLASRQEVVRQLAGALAKRIRQSDEPVGLRDWALALCCLRGMESVHAETRALLAALLHRAPKPSADTLDGSSQRASYEGARAAPATTNDSALAITISSAYFGLQQCDSMHDEVRHVLAFLEPYLLRLRDAPGAAVGGVMTGLAGARPHAATAALQWALARGRSFAVGGLERLPTQDVATLAQGCVALLRRRTDIFPLTPDEEMELADDNVGFGALYRAFAAELETREPPSSPSNTEWKLREQAAALLPLRCHFPVRVHPRARFLHGFESDIVIDIQAAGPLAPPVTLNIEIDGSQHRSGRSRRRAGVRDSHLTRQGVVVRRWDTLAHSETRPASAGRGRAAGSDASGEAVDRSGTGGGNRDRDAVRHDDDAFLSWATRMIMSVAAANS